MIRIVDYRSEYQPWFEKLNRGWIEKYFRMEEVDVNVLTRPEEFILKNGGIILMAYWNDEVAGTVALRKMKSGEFELTKMAVDAKFRGKGIGEALAKGLLDRAKEMKLKKVILYSNTVLDTAIRLYRRMGFKEIPLEPGSYERSNIKMEIELETLEVFLKN
ncbi:MAG: GNAT family N-acetyltransferase [Chitinophagales bacterium]